MNNDFGDDDDENDIRHRQDQRWHINDISVCNSGVQFTEACTACHSTFITHSTVDLRTLFHFISDWKRITSHIVI